ncbi:hypothetical protein Tco_0666218 [Tanacetum coccineum]
MRNFRGRSKGSHKALTSISTPQGRGSYSIVGHGREITDEWSLRGRGSNSRNGNDRDIIVEGTPIGRGSNNTSRNGSDRECSPRGIGSNSINRRGNERADEWCSGPDILSDERVDVHEDNEDHEIQILKNQNDDLTKKMEEERVAAKAQRETDLLEWQKTLDDRFESFSQNYSPQNERPTESDFGPS